jgi:hypothetical protein
MGFKDQIKKITDNWFIILLLLVILALPTLLVGISSIASYSNSMTSYDYAGSSGSGYINQKYYSSESMPIYDNRNFAPDEQNRKIMKTVTMSNEVKRGSFGEEETKLKAIITSSNSFLLNENVNKYGNDNNEYRTGYYSIKVEAPKYDSVITQLRTIGEVTSFNEQKEDITGQYTNAQIELDTEKSRLARYNQMYKEATLVADKITLNDRIFDEERTIKYMEDAIDNMDKTIEYSTVYFTMTEKRSEYADVVFVKFSELIRNLVGSFNAMIHLIFVLLPWVVVIGIITFVVKRIKHNKK